jgi:hypothetical protein
MNPKFRVHGAFNIHLEGALLVSEVTGPWNMELIEAWGTEALRLLGTRPAPDPLVAITTVHESILCTAEALQALRNMAIYAARHMQCLGVAMIAAPGIEGRALLGPTYRRIYEGVSPFDIFTDFDSGQAWALELLAKQGA